MSSYKTVDLDSLRRDVELKPDGTLVWRTGGRGPTRRPGNPAFATKCGNGYLQGSYNGTVLLTHRVVWALHHGCWPEDWIDHINGCRDDNRPENLRVVCQTHSNHNRRYRSSESGFLGVTRSKNCSLENPRYIAQIQSGGKHYYLGMYKTPEEAARVRDKKAIEIYGENANLNFRKAE